MFVVYIVLGGLFGWLAIKSFSAAFSVNNEPQIVPQQDDEFEDEADDFEEEDFEGDEDEFEEAGFADEQEEDTYIGPKQYEDSDDCHHEEPIDY